MLVVVEKEGPVTTIMINRPEVRNAVDRPTAEALAEAEALAGQIARFPQTCLLSDRRSTYEQWELSIHAALRNEFGLGLRTIESGETLEGAGRFSSGEGRHGTFNKE